MRVDVKFCGLTRADDAAWAASLGAAYVGVILTDSPRRVDVAGVPAILAPARGIARAVGVFGTCTPGEVADGARAAGVQVAQLHADPDAEYVDRVRTLFGGEVWAAARIAGDAVPRGIDALFEAADAVVLDARVPGRLGGTGTTFDWSRVGRALARRPRRARLVLAGGLSGANVAEAIRAVAPDVVDVSSGVERDPGIKDHTRMRAFIEAVRGATT